MTYKKMYTKLEGMTDEWINNGMYCAQDVFDLRNRIREMEILLQEQNNTIDYLCIDLEKFIQGDTILKCVEGKLVFEKI